jgi:hypothetical protein
MADDQKLAEVTDEVGSCLGISLTDADLVGMRSASGVDKGTQAVPISHLTDRHKGALVEAMDAIRPEGGDALWDGIARSVEAVRANHDPARINAVVVLTDGSISPDDSDRSIDELVRMLKQPNPVRVFIVTWGPDSDDSDLQRVADASLGRVIPSTAASGDICQSAFDYF